MRFGRTDADKAFKQQSKRESVCRKFNKRKTRHGWFAWHPVRLIGGPWVWLEVIDRSAKNLRMWYDLDGTPLDYTWDYEYRERKYGI